MDGDSEEHRAAPEMGPPPEDAGPATAESGRPPEGAAAPAGRGRTTVIPATAGPEAEPELDPAGAGHPEPGPAHAGHLGARHHGQHREPTWIAFDHVRLRRSVIMVLLLIVAARSAWWAFSRIDHLLLTLLLAWLAAISMEPVISPLMRRGMPRAAAVGLVMATGFALLIGLLAAFGGAFFSQMADLATSLPGLVRTVVQWVNETFGLTFDPNALANTLNVNTSQVATIATELAGGIVGILSSVAGWLFQIATIALFAYYFAADGPRLRRAVGSIMPASKQEVFVTVWATAVTKTGGFVISKLLLSLLSAIAHGALFFILDVPYWLPMALWVGVTSQFIPTIGTYIGIALPVLVTAFTRPVDALIIVVFATLYQQLENYILTPRISRWTMDIHPAIAFGSVLVGFALFGGIGGLVAIPVAAGIISVASAYWHRYELIPELELLEAREQDADDD